MNSFLFAFLAVAANLVCFCFVCARMCCALHFCFDEDGKTEIDVDYHRFTLLDEKFKAVAQTFDGPIKRKYDKLVLELWEEKQKDVTGRNLLSFAF